MGKFRNDTPIRRIILRHVKSHGDHKEDLKIDFKRRCGYCDDVDTWRINWFEIDHFVPKKHLVTIKSTDYSNLVYSCRSCNNAKRAIWPTKSETVHHHDNVGFIDPCDAQYAKQFTRSGTGRIIPGTPHGKWMYNSLKLYKPQHEIIWNIEALNRLIEECDSVLDTLPSGNIKDRLLGLYKAYRTYTKQLGDIN